MSLNLGRTKQAQEVIFSRKTVKANHPLLFFNENPVVLTDIRNHLGSFLDTKLKPLIIYHLFNLVSCLSLKMRDVVIIID